MQLNEILKELQSIQSEINLLVNRQSILLGQIEAIYHQPAVAPEPVLAEIDLMTDKNEEPVQEISIEPVEIVAEPAPHPEPEIIKSSAPSEQEKPAAANTSSPIPSKANLNEKLAASKATTPVEAFAEGKIDDLSKAFTLNQKLAFIKHLFGNDAELYNGVIAQLNSAADLDEARDILSRHIGDTEADILSEFMNYIHRRFL